MTNNIIIIILIIILRALFGTEPHPAAAMSLPATFCTLLGNERRYPAGMFAVSNFVACFVRTLTGMTLCTVKLSPVEI